MQRRTIALGAVLAMVAAVGGWKYYEHIEEKREAQARLQTALAIRAALDARKQAETVSPEQQEELVAMARKWLDGGENPGRARANLETVLKSNRHNAAARIQMARYYVITGQIRERSFRPGALEQAIWELTSALQADPKSADAYVLLGHVQQLRGYPWQAVADLEKAERLGGETNPWLYLNWSDALVDLNKLTEAEAKLKQAEAAFAVRPPETRVRLVLHEKFGGVYEALGRVGDAEKHYLAQIAVDPCSACAHATYANFLLFRRASPDAAIVEAEKARAIRSDMARLTLAAARYAKWAELKQKAPGRANEFLVAAKADTPDFTWIMPQAASSVGSGPAIEKMVKELVPLGVALDTKDEHGDTGLTLAAWFNRPRSVEILAKMGANLEVRDNEGQSALTMAARRGHLEVVKALHARGASVNAQDGSGTSAMNWAVARNDEAMFHALIGMKANVNLATASGYTALMQASFNGNASMAKLLLAAGADPSAQTIPEKRTAADLAESKGHKELATLLRTSSKTP